MIDKVPMLQMPTLSAHLEATPFTELRAFLQRVTAVLERSKAVGMYIAIAEIEEAPFRKLIATAFQEAMAAAAPRP